MNFVTRLDPTLADTMNDLVDLALDYLRAAIAEAGKALLAEVQAMTPEERRALPKSIYVPVPIDPDDIKKKR